MNFKYPGENAKHTEQGSRKRSSIGKNMKIRGKYVVEVIINCKLIYSLKFLFQK